MDPVVIALLVVFAIGAAVGVYAFTAPRRRAQSERTEEQRQELRVQTAWNDTTAVEFSTLPEAARCDMIFAVTTLDDERSAKLLQHALEDPSETVALAAARALSERGLGGTVDAYLTRHPGERTERIARTLALLTPEP
ncbi:MAG: hypothetical protein JOY98_10120 [Candidatus Eremiobacteraeota bacterium]|nr:hypothetical protein [Candidatus Eremiobacteraeota bacterium]